MGSEVTATALIQNPRSPPDHRVLATVIENRFNRRIFRSKTLEVCSGKPLRTSKALCVSERKKIRPQYVYPVRSRRGKRDKKENVNWVFNSSSKESRRTVSEWYIRDGFRTRRSPRPPARGTADTIVTLSRYTVELADTLHQASFNSCSEYTFGTLERHGGVQRSAPWAPQSTPRARPNNWHGAKNIATEEKCTGLDDIQIIYPSSPETL